MNDIINMLLLILVIIIIYSFFYNINSDSIKTIIKDNKILL